MRLADARTLQTTRLDGAGGTPDTRVDFAQGVGNTNGALTCSGAEFQASCNGCALVGAAELACSCRDEAGSFAATSVDPDNCVTNSGGQLSC